MLYIRQSEAEFFWIHRIKHIKPSNNHIIATCHYVATCHYSLKKSVKSWQYLHCFCWRQKSMCSIGTAWTWIHCGEGWAANEWTKSFSFGQPILTKFYSNDALAYLEQLGQIMALQAFAFMRKRTGHRCGNQDITLRKICIYIYI